MAALAGAPVVADFPIRSGDTVVGFFRASAIVAVPIVFATAHSTLAGATSWTPTEFSSIRWAIGIVTFAIGAVKSNAVSGVTRATAVDAGAAVGAIVGGTVGATLVDGLRRRGQLVMRIMRRRRRHAAGRRCVVRKFAPLTFALAHADALAADQVARVAAAGRLELMMLHFFALATARRGDVEREDFANTADANARDDISRRGTVRQRQCQIERHHVVQLHVLAVSRVAHHLLRPATITCHVNVKALFGSFAV